MINKAVLAHNTLPRGARSHEGLGLIGLCHVCNGEKFLDRVCCFHDILRRLQMRLAFYKWLFGIIVEITWTQKGFSSSLVRKVACAMKLPSQVAPLPDWCPCPAPGHPQAGWAKGCCWLDASWSSVLEIRNRNAPGTKLTGKRVSLPDPFPASLPIALHHPSVQTCSPWLSPASLSYFIWRAHILHQASGISPRTSPNFPIKYYTFPQYLALILYTLI